MNNYATIKRHWQQGYLEDWEFIEAAWLQYREDDARMEVKKYHGKFARTS